MSKATKIIIAIIAVIVVIGIIVFAVSSLNKDVTTDGKKQNTTEEISSASDLISLVDKIYSNVPEDVLPRLETSEVDVTEANMVSMYTGLENGEDLEYLVVSQPLMSAQAYTLVLAKVKNGVNASNIAKSISEQVDTRRWICVEADKVLATNSGDIVCMVMADEDMTQNVYDSFKQVVQGKIGEEFERTAEQAEILDIDGTPVEIY